MGIFFLDTSSTYKWSVVLVKLDIKIIPDNLSTALLDGAAPWSSPRFCHVGSSGKHANLGNTDIDIGQRKKGYLAKKNYFK